MSGWTYGLVDYLGGVKPFTVASYECQIRNHIQPALGAIRLEALNAHTIQGFYNKLSQERDGRPGLSPKSVKNVHGVLHKALQQAVMIGYIHFNPSAACTLPRMVRSELKPLDIRSGDDIKTIQGNLGHATAVFTLDVYGMSQNK